MKKTTKYILIGLGIIIAFNIISNLFESEPEPLPDKYLKVETSRIKGHLGDCFEVVSKEYKVKRDYSSKLMIELKRLDSDSELLNTHIDNITGSDNEGGKCYIDFIIEFLDENSNVVAKTKSSSYSRDQIVSLVKNTRAGETGIIEFYVNDDTDINSFRLGSICEVKPVEQSVQGISDLGIEETMKEITDIANDQELEKAVEDMGKILDTELQLLDAAGKALKVLDQD
ncbi:MAG: hypothetical protein J6A40_00010 [Bacteroides sp.]|nr:hypothetical protein [Bacteroides sp.]MBR4048062.1 hypothetical protein [Bacteroides sp.]